MSTIWRAWRVRLGLLLGMSLTLAGCGQGTWLGGVAALGGQSLATLRAGGVVSVIRTPTISPERLARTKGQLLYVNIESRGSDAYLRPAAKNGAVTTWVARGGITVSTRAGVALTSTRGLGADLMSARIDELLARRGRAGASGGVFAARTHRLLDGEGQLVPTTWVCELVDRGREMITWPGGERAARRVDERCYREGGRRNEAAFVNVYWSSPSGIPLRSQQWAGPGIGFLNIYLLQGGA